MLHYNFNHPNSSISLGSSAKSADIISTIRAGLIGGASCTPPVSEIPGVRAPATWDRSHLETRRWFCLTGPPALAVTLALGIEGGAWTLGFRWKRFDMGALSSAGFDSWRQERAVREMPSKPGLYLHLPNAVVTGLDP